MAAARTCVCTPGRACPGQVFHCDGRYYSQLWAQQNMLQDAVRTGAYHSAGEGGGTRSALDDPAVTCYVSHVTFTFTLRAVSMNASDFSRKAVLDVGAGSGMCVGYVALRCCRWRRENM